MFLSHIKRLCTILPTLIAASPQDTDPSSSISNSLPAQLQRVVPACAQPCLRSALQAQFPLSCTVQEDIGCLCSQYSNRGESLGEEALRCIYSSCPTVDKASSTYNVCLGQKNAVRPTQTALTVAATMSSSTTSSSARQTSTFTTSTSVQPTTSNTLAVNSNPFISSTSSSVSTTSPTAAPAMAGAAPGPKTMSAAQIAGLSVAAAATFIVAIGLMALSVFLRRKRERKEIVDITEKKPQSFSPKAYSSRYSQLPPRDSSRWIPPKRFPVIPELSAQRSNESLKVKSKKATTSRPNLVQVNPNTVLYAVPPTSSPPKTSSRDFSSIHPLLRPGASRNSSAFTVPLDQIGLAISAELPGKSVNPKFLLPPREAETRQHRPKSFRRSLGLGIIDRDDRSSVLTTNTIFEEDAPLARRRSSMLLPTPPVPIPPIRALQPSRPPPTFNPRSTPLRTSPTRQQATTQQPELFLNIPVRHSRQSPPRISPVDSPQSRDSPQNKPQLAPAINITSVYAAGKPTTATASTSETSNIEDIPDYYFTSYDLHRQPSPQPLKSTKLRSPISTPSPRRIVRSKDSPKVIVIKPKTSGSTTSRTASRTSTTIRDSISSQTSFETTGSNDPTPEDEDDKQLSSEDEKKLSPVAESPISNLRYPKVPRASNQLVPRSPRSAQSLARQQAQLQTQFTGSPRIPSPSALLVKRRGEREALELESQLHTGSPKVKDPMKKYRSHLRSNSVVEAWDAGPTVLTERATRAQSGQWPKSPAMYDDSVVRPAPLNVKGKAMVDGGLKSPMWVPHLTPTRMGEDLLISVRYSKGDRR